MELTKVVYPMSIRSQDLAESIKLTTERSFYANELLKVLLDYTDGITEMKSSFNQNDEFKKLHITLEKYSQKVRNRIASNHCGLSEMGKPGK